MGRTGGGRSGGGSHSSHSSSRSHSSHVSSGRGSGSSGLSGWGRSSGGGYHRPRYSRPVFMPGSFYGGFGTFRFSSVVLTIVIVAVMFAFVSAVGSAGRQAVPASSMNRERISGGSFTERCVTDELGWVAQDGSSEEQLGRRLQYFWDQTGIQPYVVLLPYSTEYDTQQERYDYAEAWYEDHIDDEKSMLLMYFDAQSQYENGEWEMVKGLQTDTVMDSEATEIFWAYNDKYWSDLDYSVPEAVEGMFRDTADRIMKRTTTWLDIFKILAIGAVVIGVGITAVHIINAKRKKDAQANAEAERILNTPLEKQVEDSLLDKYKDQ